MIKYERSGPSDNADPGRRTGVDVALPPVGGRSPLWHEEALCKGMPVEIFFGEEGIDKRPTLSLTQLRDAREICDQCPVARQCLTHALTFPEPYGIWAGTSGNAREKLVRGIRDQGLDVGQVVDTYLEMN